MAKLYNLARMTTATTGTGTITLGSAVSGYLSFASTGVTDGETVAYSIGDGASSEVGYGVYTAAGTTLTRNVVNSTNSNTAINLSGSAQVYITPSARDVGKWTNRRIAKTANYTLTNADAGATVALGGSAFYTLTINAASGYDSDFTITVLNEDTGRGKTIAPNGLTSFILWPGQTCSIYNQNNVWKVNPSFQRWAKGALNLYVDATNGNNSNDGLAAGSGNAVATIATAVSLLYQYIDCQNSAPTINLAAGTYTESITINGQTIGYNYLLFLGAGSASTTWKPGAGGFCLTVGDNAECQVQAIKFDNTSGSTNCIGLSVHQDGVIDVLTDINFGTFPTGGGASRHINSDQGGFINMPASYTISGAANWHMNIGPGTVVAQAAGGTITFSGTFTVSILYRLTGCFMYFSGVESFSIGTATVTSGYSVDFLGVLQLNGTTVTGGAGTTAHGSQVA
jgi:hypothetical protein